MLISAPYCAGDSITMTNGFTNETKEASFFKVDNDFQGIKLHVSDDFSERKVFIDGIFQIYVRKGSQLAIWSQFPSTILYHVRDTNTDKVIHSEDYMMSISYDRSTIEMYANMPGDQIVNKTFTENLFEIIPELPWKNTTYEVIAEYMGLKSEPVYVTIQTVKGVGDK